MSSIWDGMGLEREREDRTNRLRIVSAMVDAVISICTRLCGLGREVWVALR